MTPSDPSRSTPDEVVDQAAGEVVAADTTTATTQQSTPGEARGGMTDLQGRMERVRAEAEEKAKRARAVKADKAAQIEKDRAEKAQQVTHKVKSSDTLSTIGAKYGVPWTAIAETNNIANPDLIFAGQVFVIPQQK